MLRNHKNCFLNDKVMLKSQQRFKSDYTEQINKIALSSDDNKRLKTSD